MSETATPAELLGEQPVGSPQRLRGNLGVAWIVFMVVAAAAQLGAFALGAVIGTRVTDNTVSAS